MPHALELPWMLRAIVPLVRGQRLAFFVRRIIGKPVTFRCRHPVRQGCRLALLESRLKPGLAAVVRPLNDLAEPATALRGIDSVGIHGRSFHVIDFPSAKERTVDGPT